MKDKIKKDYKYLNVSVDRRIFIEFDEFCKEYGMSKTGATEKALIMYMKKIRNIMSQSNENDL